MVRDPAPPPPPDPLLAPQPASAAAISASAAPAYANRRRRADSFAASQKLSIASIAATTVTTTNGVLGGRGSAKNPGGSADSAIVNWAMQLAPAEFVAPAGVQVTAAPRFALPFLNCTVPVGPCDESLGESTLAVIVTLAPAWIVLGLAVTVVAVATCVLHAFKRLLTLTEPRPVAKSYPTLAPNAGVPDDAKIPKPPILVLLQFALAPAHGTELLPSVTSLKMQLELEPPLVPDDELHLVNDSP